MSETAIIWLFGVMGAWCLALTYAGFNIKMEQVKTKVAIDLFIDTLGEKLAKVLHNDDDHLHLDTLLDKLLDPDYDMNYDEWFELKNRCNHILDSKNISQLERGLAGVMAGICDA